MCKTIKTSLVFTIMQANTLTPLVLLLDLLSEIRKHFEYLEMLC